MSTDEEDRGSEIRLFLAIAIPDSIRTALLSTQSELKKAQARVSWVPDENLHLSLAFIGPVTDDRVASLIDGLAPLATRHACFDEDVSTVGAFGRPRRPRVLWAGCDASAELMQLHTDVLAYLKTLNFKVDERPFRPHITLGRVRAAENIDALNDALEAQQETSFGSFNVDRLVLYKSTLQASQAVHEPLHTAALA